MTELRRRLPARLEDVLAVLEEAQGFLPDWGLSPRSQNAVELALEELLSNVAKYAYPDGTPGEVEVLLELGPAGVRLELADRGAPFDPTAVPPPPPLTIDAAPGGRGLHLVKSFARSMRYLRDGDRNVLVVELPAH